MRYGLIGAAGYIAPRHMKAIKETGGVLAAACDVRDSVGILDSYNIQAEFFTDPVPLHAFLLDYVAICTPNFLHLRHCTQVLRMQFNAVCEKPLGMNCSELDRMRELEEKYDRRVYTVLQLRQSALMRQLREQVTGGHKVELVYHTPRGPWYQKSWKADPRCSGGLLLNIGVHMLDLLLWMFGEACEVRENWLGMEKAEVTYDLSIDAGNVPERSITIDGQRYEISGFADLHTAVYRDILEGKGTGIEDARPALQLVERIQHDTSVRV